jgi:pimeloyl-ACP methyl ester carboxylesterase
MDEPRRIEVPSGTIAFMDFGEGFPLLLIHGLFTSSRNFDRLLARRTVGVRCVAFDLPGCGGSTGAPGFEPGWHSFSRYVVELADALGIERFDLLGHSMGGGIAIMTAAGWPKRVRRLVLVDAVSLPFDVPLKGRLPLLPLVGEAMFRMYGRGMFLDYFARDVFVDRSKMDLAKIEGFYETFVRNRSCALAALRATANPRSVTAAVKEISCPTLLLWGAGDRLIPSSIGRSLEGMIPGSALVTLEGCGHVPLEERPDESAAAIFGFLRKEVER